MSFLFMVVCVVWLRGWREMPGWDISADLWSRTGTAETVKCTFGSCARRMKRI